MWNLKIALLCHSGSLAARICTCMPHCPFHAGSSFRVLLKPPDVDFETAHLAAQKTHHQGATLQELLSDKANANTLQVRRGKRG